MLRVNVGCGMSPTPGWVNIDNSPSLRLARLPGGVRVAEALGLLNPSQRAYVEFCRTHDVRWGDSTRHIPLPDASAEVVYTSHMVEHLDRGEAVRFLREAWRVLAPGGILRVSVPDIALHARRYLEEGDADAFVKGILLARERPRSLRDKLRFLVVGDRDHHWMYDGPSLSRLVAAAGFTDVRVLPPGETTIPDPGALDLYERAGESVYVEGRKPASPADSRPSHPAAPNGTR